VTYLDDTEEEPPCCTAWQDEGLTCYEQYSAGHQLEGQR